METNITKSDLLPLIKSINLMEVFPKILNVDKKNFKITPSEFIKEMNVTTEERFRRLSHMSTTVKILDNNYPPLIQVIPYMLVFQRFEARGTYCLPLQIRNNGKNLLQLKMHCPRSTYFSAKSVSPSLHKLAPGLSLEYEITFTPKEAKDYYHELIFKSKDDIFQVPILAIGARPILDIPDHIVLEPTPVKIEATKSIIVRNIGNYPAVFNFINQSQFRISPSKGFLGINDTLVVTVHFESPKVGEVSESIYLVFETGEKLPISLHASAENISVRLEKNSVVHDDTLIGLKRCKVVRLFNNSSSVLKFSWRRYKTEEEDLDMYTKMKEKFQELNEVEIKKDTIPIHYGLSDPENHKLSSERILKDELRLLEKEVFSFSHDAFCIMPMNGEIWPRSNIDMMISFEPKVVGVATAEAYLEVLGRDSRLPLRIKGNGLGPQIVLNVNTLDTDYIYLCSFHKYEVIAMNKSDIPGCIEYVANNLVFGGKVEVTPDSRLLDPGECGVFIVSFTSNRSGNFIEKLQFRIKESGEEVDLTLKGRIASPTLHFDKRQIDFGNIPVGFPVVREVNLNNLSLVPVTFSLKMLSDGDTPSLSFKEFAAYKVKPNLPQSCKEFKIEPKESVVEPFSHKKVTLTLTANRAGYVQNFLIVDLWDSVSGSVSCPVKFHSHVANIAIEPKIISVPFCFLNFPYTRTVTLHNTSKVAGYFCLVPSSSVPGDNITFSFSIPQGIIEPKSSLHIDLSLKATVVGRHSLPVQLIVFGNNEQSESLVIFCVGQGPVVTVSPNSLSWNDLPLLQSRSKKIVLSNESPIPATLNVCMIKPNSQWTTSFSEYTLPPQEFVDLNVSVLLYDRGKHTDFVKIDVLNGKEMKILVTAFGTGCSLNITPTLNPRFDLGTHFSNRIYQLEITIENKGSKPHGVLWSPLLEYKSFLTLKDSSPKGIPFKFEPHKIDIQPYETKTVILEVCSPSIGVFSHTFYCFINVGRPQKELLMSCEISAEFVEPLVETDKTQMNFYRNLGGEGRIEEKLEDEVGVTNLSILPIKVVASVRPPFYFKKEDEESNENYEVNLNGHESKKIKITFSPEESKTKYSLKFTDKLLITFKQHSKKCLVDLIGEVNYPNVLVLPTQIVFEDLPIGTSHFKEINLVNISPLDVYYEIVWNPKNSTISNMDKPNVILGKMKAFDCKEERPEPQQQKQQQPQQEQQQIVENVTQPENELLEEKTETREEPVDVSQNVSPPVKPVAKMPNVIISEADIKAVLFPLTRNQFRCDDELLEAYTLTRSFDVTNPQPPPDYSRVCDITPFYGKLEKFASQILIVRFFSYGPLSIQLEAFIKIESGPTEVISIKANTDEICFQLNSTEFDFGKQLFCETKCEKLKIQNTGLVSLPYEVYTKNDLPSELNNDLSLDSDRIVVTPKCGKITSFEEAELSIRHNPGKPGKFDHKIYLQIAHLNPITIKIKGIAVFPQVHITLPRPDILNVEPKIGYMAVARITPDWCLTSAKDWKKRAIMTPVKAYRSVESDVGPQSEKLELETDEWEFIESLEFYPTETDIQLAIERMLAQTQMKTNLSRNPSFAVYARAIPSFIVPAYEMDFGIAVIGRILEYKVRVINYGPLPVVMYGICDSQMKEEGFHVRLKNRNELKVGGCLQFVVYFFPKKPRFKEQFEEAKCFFHFEIYHGPRVPIKLVANVTYPHVISSMSEMNYYDVQCGCCKVMNLKLKNPGLVPAHWSLVNLATTKLLQELGNLDVRDGTSMFHLNYSSGILNPNEYCTIQITFKPELGGSFASALNVNVAESLEDIKIMLFGEGLEPTLKITDEFINFEPTLPYPNKYEKNFVVENPCDFPIEFYLPTFDEQIFEEDKIIRATCLYYRTKELLLPVRKPGEGLPIELINFYQMLLDDLNAKYMEEEREKLEFNEENSNTCLFGEDNQMISGSQVSFVDKKRKKTRKSFSRSRTSMESRIFTANNESSRDLLVPTIFEKKTPDEIEEMLHDHIKNLLLLEPSHDPIQASFKSILQPVQAEYQEGKLFIFYGAPYTNHVQMANRCACITGLQVFSIDRIVLEEAVHGRCEAGAIVRELIENAYWEHVEPKEYLFTEEFGESGGSEVINKVNFDDQLDEIQRKLNALVTLRENLIATKAKGPAVSSAKSDIPVGVTSKNMNLNASLANITEDLVCEVLKYRLSLETGRGVIIEGLQSLFISSSVKALGTVLKAAGNIKDIFAVFLLHTYLQYDKHISILQKEQENLKLEVCQEVLRILEEEPEHVFESLGLTEQEAEQAHSTFLSQRRENQHVFEKQRDSFYENEKLKRGLIKNGLPRSSFNNVKFDSSAEKVQKDKKDKKKEQTKANKSVEGNVGKAESETKSEKIKKDSLEIEFSEFENDFMEMKTLINSWDQRIGGPVVDGSGELKVKKGMTPRRMESNLAAKEKTDRGVFLWLIDVSRPDSQIFNGVCHYLRSFLEIKIPTESDNWPLAVTDSMTFSVVPYPPLRTKDVILENFTLTPIEPVCSADREDTVEDLIDVGPPTASPSATMKLNRSSSQLSFKSRRKSSVISKRRKTDSRTSADIRNSKTKKLGSAGALESFGFRSRWVLLPGESIKWRVKYFPTEVGESEQIYTINVVTWKNFKTIHCVGKCDIPSLDMTPEVVFSSVKPSRPVASPYSPGYFQLDEIFDFGSIIFVPSADNKKIAKKSASFTLTNNSMLPLELSVTSAQNVLGDPGHDSAVIKFEPNTAALKPGESLKLSVSTNPHKSGSVTEVLMIFIKDNPKIESIKVMYEAVKANLSLEPKLVNFDRILLNRKAVRRIMFTNNHLIPFFITLHNYEQLGPQFSFSDVSGWVSPLQTFTIEIEYTANQAQTISEQRVVVLVFNDVQMDHPLQELYFSISVEAYDAALDIFFAEKEEDHINFGDIRVETNCIKGFSLKNVGKYPLAFRIDIVGHVLEGEGNQFLVSPQEGTLPPGKMSPLTVSFRTNNEVTWKRLTVFKVLLVEPYKGDEMIATIPIDVSVRSFFARYLITPLPDFNFGHIRIGNLAKASLLIENQGHFSLTYFIENKSAIRAAEVLEDTKKSSKPSASSKDRTKKIPLPPVVLTLGPFEISPSTGIAEVGQTAVVSISCLASEAKTYEEKIVILVNESQPDLKKGSELTLSAAGCLPSIDFLDVKNIFREHFICKKETDFKLPAKTGSYTLFTEDNGLFSFKNACVCKTAEARIHLPNSGLIECNVTALVSSSNDTGSRTSYRKDVCNFDVSPSKFIIEPYNFGTLTITFRPEAIEVYRGVLTITLEMPDGYDDVSHTFPLFGNGILPQIEITEPNSMLPEGEVVVNFPPTSPGQYSTSSIAFSNVGLIDCKVIVELYNNEDGVFTMTPKEGTENMLKVWELNKPIDHTVLVSISPDQTAKFNLMFNPQEIKSFSSEIKLSVVDNPFENFCYKLRGEVFFEEVMIEKIRTALSFLSDSTESKSSTHSSPGQYTLNYGDCYVKKKSKALLRLVNKTEKEYFKFEWEEIQHITVYPDVGHLYPNTYKEILITFYPNEPMELEEVPLVCVLNKIHFENPPEISWDSRLVQYQRQPKKNVLSPAINKEAVESSQHLNTERIKIGGDEPQFELIPESNKTLLLNISAMADYTRLYCETTKIIFKNTFMFQTRIYPLVLGNPGNVTLEYKLSLKSLTCGPIKKNQFSQIKEQSLLKLDLKQNRPRSSASVYGSRSSFQRHSKSERCERPRPLTSASFLNLNYNSSETGLEKPTVVEQKPITYNPFVLESPSGQIPPREKATCNILFSPMDINEYNVLIDIQVMNLHPECTLPEIQVTASSIMPYCHFDIPESDYLESGRRDYSRPGPIGLAPGLPLDPETKTIEIKVLGTNLTVPIEFHVINPTEDDYTFSWINVTQVQPDVVPSFHCSTLDGRIQGGRQQLMAFTFVSQKIGVTESFWKFCISKFGVETLFLFVADVREPAVFCLSTHIILKPTFIGSSSFDDLTLINNEEIPFDFAFLPDSLYSEGRLNVLKVDPIAGRIPANSEVSVRVTFTGKSGGKVLFNLKCKIKNVKELITISVETTTYVVQPLLVFEDLKKIKHYVNSSVENVIDFGTELIPNCPETIELVFTSVSKTSFFYEWIYDKNALKSHHCKLKFKLKSGHIPSLTRGKCELTIVFSKKSSLMNFPVKLKISRGPTFNFLIKASASTPSFELSFNSYDFGYCFLEEKNICSYETPLYIKNKDTNDIIVECHLAESSPFSYKLPEAVIPSGAEGVVNICFHPKEVIPYSDTLRVVVNGFLEKIVSLKGHGTEYKVTLTNPDDTTVSLGAVRVGKTSCREFSLSNKSLAAAKVLVGFSDQLPVDISYLSRPDKHVVDLSRDHRLSNIITITPSTVFTIKPHERFTVRVAYTPKSITSRFSETVSLQYQERVEPLCVITGSCLGPEILLDRYFLNFGAVLENCSRILKLKLVNSGSIGARFQWETQNIQEYSISPVSGYSSPGSDVTIEVTFRPIAVANCIRNRVECKLQLSPNESYPSMFLNLMGDCLSMPDASETVRFECRVRKTDTKTLEIKNESGTEWQLVPVVSGEYFKGYEVLVVPSLSTVQYEVEYCPLTMTEKEKFHEGSVFFPFPNGKGLLFRLLGSSLPPDPEDVIVREVPAKTKYVELLKIRNWLQYPKRFKVNINCVSNNNIEDPVWTCTGCENLELPTSAEKEYSLTFFAYKTGHLQFHVKFTTEETQEYMWYDISFNIIKGGPLEVVTLKSGVRQSAQYELKLENPLTKVVQYKLESTSSDISFESSLQEVSPKQSKYVKVFFTPVLAQEHTENLIAKCDELGIFLRELRLIGVEAQPEPPRTFETFLGSFQTQEIAIKNLSQSNAVLRCKTDSEDFVVNAQTNVAARQVVHLNVTYEPSEMGSTTATLTVESEQAGNFVFPLLGFCVKPTAKGPFTLKPGSGLTITFKNVFRTSKEFHISVDNPAFVLKTAQEIILPKDECKIYVGFQKVKNLEKMSEFKEKGIEPRFPIMGQMVVECLNPYVKWQYYLKGVFDK